MIERIQICAQGAAVSLSDRDDDPQLFEVLFECFPAEIDLAGFEEVPHISFQFRCGKAAIPLAMRRIPCLGNNWSIFSQFVFTKSHASSLP